MANNGPNYKKPNPPPSGGPKVYGPPAPPKVYGPPAPKTVTPPKSKTFPKVRGVQPVNETQYKIFLKTVEAEKKFKKGKYKYDPNERLDQKVMSPGFKTTYRGARKGDLNGRVNKLIKEREEFEAQLERIENIKTVVTFIPVVGEGVQLAENLVKLKHGEKVDLLDWAACIPVVGKVGKAAKVAKVGGKFLPKLLAKAPKIEKLLSKTPKLLKAGGELISKAGKFVKGVLSGAKQEQLIAKGAKALENSGKLGKSLQTFDKAAARMAGGAGQKFLAATGKPGAFLNKSKGLLFDTAIMAPGFFTDTGAAPASSSRPVINGSQPNASGNGTHTQTASFTLNHQGQSYNNDPSGHHRVPVYSQSAQHRQGYTAGPYNGKSEFGQQSYMNSTSAQAQNVTLSAGRAQYYEGLEKQHPQIAPIQMANIQSTQIERVNGQLVITVPQSMSEKYENGLHKAVVDQAVKHMLENPQMTGSQAMQLAHQDMAKTEAGNMAMAGMAARNNGAFIA